MNFQVIALTVLWKRKAVNSSSCRGEAPTQIRAQGHREGIGQKYAVQSNQ